MDKLTYGEQRVLSRILEDNACECLPGDDHQIDSSDWQWCWRLLSRLLHESVEAEQ